MHASADVQNDLGWMASSLFFVYEYVRQSVCSNPLSNVELRSHFHFTCCSRAKLNVRAWRNKESSRSPESLCMKVGLADYYSSLKRLANTNCNQKNLSESGGQGQSCMFLQRGPVPVLKPLKSDAELPKGCKIIALKRKRTLKNKPFCGCLTTTIAPQR